MNFVSFRNVKAWCLLGLFESNLTAHFLFLLGTTMTWRATSGMVATVLYSFFSSFRVWHFLMVRLHDPTLSFGEWYLE